VLWHRYAGLTMALFLVIEGLTGSVLAFYEEFDRWLNPQLLTVRVRNTAPLDPLTLHERAEALDPRAYIKFIEQQKPIVLTRIFENLPNIR